MYSARRRSISGRRRKGEDRYLAGGVGQVKESFMKILTHLEARVLQQQTDLIPQPS